MAANRNIDGTIMKWFFYLSLLLSGYVAWTFVPPRELVELVPSLQKYFPKTELNPEKLKNSHQLDFRNIETLSRQLKEKEKYVKQREGELNRDAQLNQRLKEEVTEYRRQVTAMQEKISKLITEIEAAEEKNLKKLASVYNVMDAEEASTLVKSMSDKEIVNIFALMKPRQVSKILGAYAMLSAEDAARAAKLVEQIRELTTKRKEPPKP